MSNGNKGNLKEAKRLLHDLSNRMIVVDKAYSIFSKHLPSHRLTELGESSLSQALDIIQDLKKELLKIEEPKELLSNVKFTNTDTEMASFLVSQRDIFEQMCVMSVEFEISKVDAKRISLTNKEVLSIFELFLEDSALANSTQIKIQLHSSPSCFKISISDNSDGSTFSSGVNLKRIEEMLKIHDARCKPRSICDIGSCLILEIPFL